VTIYGWDLTNSPSPSSLTRRLVSNTAIKRSSLTGAIQTVARPGERWEIDVTWNNIKGEGLNTVLAFLRRLNGAEHRVRFHSYDADNKGAGGGSPVVDGGSQTGTSLDIRGGPTSTTGFMKAGDFFRFLSTNMELKQCVADVDTDGSGDATINFVPAIRNSPSDGTAIDDQGSISGDYILITPVESAISATSRTSGGDFVASISVSFVEEIR